MGFQNRNFNKKYNLIYFNSTNLHSYSTWRGETNFKISIFPYSGRNFYYQGADLKTEV